MTAGENVAAKEARMTEPAKGMIVYGPDRGKLGTIERVPHSDDATFVVLKPGLSEGKRLAPFREGEAWGDGIRVPYDAQTVERAPDIEGNNVDEETFAEAQRI
jgi:hypothetical protein